MRRRWRFESGARRRLLPFLALLLTASAVRGAVFRELSVSHEQGVYHVYADVLIEAPLDEVRYVITDYAHFTWISPAVLESRVLERFPDGTLEIYTVTRACAAFFCRRLEQVQRVRRLSENEIVAETMPERSNAEYGLTRWLIEAESTGTRLRWETSIEPRFWVPPLIGPALMRRALFEQGKSGIRGIEILARRRAGLAE
ncbi:MAG TPA: SRPBCC family protein [Gammaproteobacteria bacterium]|nr:SRPBCC family protein [Gammaproteobacteria bacterium]